MTGRTRVLGAILCLLVFHYSIEAFGAVAPGTNSVKLAWNKSPSTNVTGYRVYYGATSGSYSNSIVVGNTTNNTVGGLAGGVAYYFAVASYTASGVLSIFSSEISYVPLIPAAPSRVATMRRGVVTVRGLAGKQYDILATQNLTTWTLIGTVTLGVSGTLNFTDPNAGSFARRFYRVQQRP
jgi:Fibronectin type III domain